MDWLKHGLMIDLNKYAPAQLREILLLWDRRIAREDLHRPARMLFKDKSRFSGGGSLRRLKTKLDKIGGPLLADDVIR
ncbi:MAG: hypothetical protein MRJ68_12945 [Nitrospira sp.]|nr:hypothetical protein [Nitrospira sp.]